MFGEINLFIYGLKATASSIPAKEAEQNGAVVKVDEGMEDFFTKKVTKISFR